jgi:outer membrane receptor protein involved in Fe transport
VNNPALIIAGTTSLQRYQQNIDPAFMGLVDGNYATRYQNLKDKEDAFFGELNWWVTNTIKLTGGVRRSTTSFHYRQIFFGTINGSYNPDTIAGGVTDGTVSETPISPKFGAQWQFTPDDQLYFTAAKGYRAGGVNSPLSAGQCGPALASVGLTVDQVPKTFDSDSIWSYELGTKLRLFDKRLAVNAAVYKIDWSGLQIPVGVRVLGCGQQWIQNLGSAESRGVDLEASFRVFQGFTVSLNANYNDAHYSADAFGPKPTNGSAPQKFASNGQSLGLEPYRINLQAQYSWRLMGKFDAYVRADYTYTPHYTTLAFGQANWNPDTSFVPKSELVNFRAGVTYQAIDFSLFVNNVTNSKDALGGGGGLGAYNGGRTGCAPATGSACSVFTSYTPNVTYYTFRPREVGVQAIYHF